jgi:hypothetical protein
LEHDILDKATIEDLDKTQESYKEEVITQPQKIDIDSRFDDGTVKITQELLEAAKYAVETRLNATHKYTSEKIERMNSNFELYYSAKKEGEAQLSKFIPETFNNVEDWTDDLYLIFKNFYDMIEIDSSSNAHEARMVQQLEVEEAEDTQDMAILRSMAKQVNPEEAPGQLQEKANYLFKKSEALKSKLIEKVKESGFRDELKTYLWNGIITGQFVFRDYWGPTREQELCYKKGNVSYDVKQKNKYHFKAVDPRLLIHPKEDFSFVGELIQTTYSDLMELVLDDNGKPLKNSAYDIKLIKLLGEYIKEHCSSDLKQRIEDLLSDEETSETDVNELDDLANIVGELTVIEMHNIPLRINGKTQKCVVAGVDLSGRKEALEDEEGKEYNFLPIKICPTPYVCGDGHPYHFVNFKTKDNDKAGRGLPAIAEPLQKIVNDFISHANDMMNFGLWGVIIIDGDRLKQSNLDQMKPKQIIELKNTRGAKIDDLYSWLTPDTGVINSTMNFLDFYISYIKRTSRKGPTGEKISPNPTATEIASMIEELQKSVNSIVLDINDRLREMVKRIYIYEMLNSTESFNVKTEGTRIREYGEGENKNIDIIQAKKILKTNMKELFIDGVKFDVKAAEEHFKKATERQQIMQAVKLFFDTGAIKGPDGRTVFMEDENGEQWKVNFLKLIKKVGRLFSVEDVLEKVGSEELKRRKAEDAAIQEQQRQEQSNSNVPELDASPDTADILAGVMNQGTQI